MDTIKLLNPAGAVIATAPAADLLAINPFDNQAVALVADVDAQHAKAVAEALDKLGPDATEVDMIAVFDKVAADLDIAGRVVKLLTDGTADAVHKALRPLADNLANQLTGDGKELETFVRGVIAGGQHVIIQTARKQKENR